MLSGASLTTEKAYLMGKFARVCLKTPYIDYNGRLCMVSAAAANKKAFGVDRAANPWSDIIKAKVVWVSGANIAECAPITTHYVWQAREHGAQIIMVDPRITPAARTCDLFLPVKPGRDIALFNGVLRLMIENDWLDHDFIREHTVGFDKVAEHVHEWTPRRTAKVTGVSERSIRRAAEMWGTAPTSFLLHARGIEHHTHGVQNCLGAINIVMASGRIGREGCGYATITGQGNGQGGREHGQKCDQLPGGRDIDNPEHRAHVAKVWGVDPGELPHSGVDCYEIFRKIDSGEIRGLLSICFNPKVSLPDNHFVERMLNKLDFYVAIDFFLNETAQHANIVLPGSLQEEDEGVVTQIEGRVIKINKAVEAPGAAREDWHIIQDIAHKLGRDRGFTFSGPREIFEEFAAPRPAGSPTTPASLTSVWRGSTAFSGPARPKTIPVRRACSRKVRGTQSPKGRDASTSPTARRSSSSPRTRRRRKTWTTNTPSSSRRGAWSANSYPARKRAASGLWSISTRNR